MYLTIKLIIVFVNHFKLNSSLSLLFLIKDWLYQYLIIDLFFQRFNYLMLVFNVSFTNLKFVI